MKAKTYATVLAIVVLSAVSGEFLIFASNLRTRHRAEALLTAVRHLRLGQPRSELQWLLSEYDAAAAESSAPPAPSLKGLFTIPPSPAPKTPAVPYPEGANVPLHSQETYFIYAFPRAVNKIASASLLLWKLGVVPWAVEVRLELEEGKLSSLSYSAGFGTVSAGAPKELAAMARVRDYPGLVPGPDYNIGYDLRPSSIMPHASGLFRLGAVITPKATEQQRNSAFDFDLSCFSTLHGCRSLCEVMPNVWKEAIQRSLKKEITLPAEELENPACRGR